MHRVSKYLMGWMVAVSMAAAPWAWAAPVYPGGPQSGAYLGVMVDKVSPETAATLHLSGGTAISNVDQDGPACQAGLKGGDIVTAFNGKPVSGPEQFAGLIHGSAPSSTVTLTVLRDGHSREMKVKLGNWAQMAPLPPVPPRAPLSAAGAMPPSPPPPLPPVAWPDIEVHAYTPMVARSGIVVEPLSPQLCEFFGVPTNEGVLVRSVEKGSPGASAGLKAGDVIVRVNDEAIHDMGDWKRALKAQGGKVTLSIMRDKRSQTVQMMVPASTSRVESGDWEAFDQEMQTLAAEMEKLGPEFEQDGREMAALTQLDQAQIDEIHRQAKSAAKAAAPEMKKQAEAMRKQAEQMRKDMAKLTPEMARTAKEMAESMKPTAKEWADMAREMQKSLEEMQPELQKEMDEFQKEWQQEMREWQENLKGRNPKQL